MPKKSGTVFNAYCLKDKKKVDAVGKLDKDKNGKPRWSGVCPECDGKVFKYAKSSEV